MVAHSSTLAWKIPWTEEPGSLQPMGSLRVGLGWATSLSLLAFMHWKRQWQPTPVFLPGESQGRWSLMGCRRWVTERRTRLKRLSSSKYKTAQVNGLLKTKVVCILKRYQEISITYIVHNKIECKRSYNLMSHFYLSIMLLEEYYKS